MAESPAVPTARPAGASLRGRIPALRASEAEALRQLFAGQVCWPLQNERILAFASLRRPGGMGGVFELDGDGTRLALRLDRGDAPASSPEWSDYQGRSRLLAWSLTHEQALVQLSEALGAPLLPVAELEPDRAAGAASDAIWLSFSIEDMYEPEAGAPAYYQSGELQLPVTWLGRLLGRAEPIDPDNPLPDLSRFDSLPAPVSVACPGPTLEAREWRSLRPGDVIVLGSRSQPPPLHASANGRRWPVASETDGCRITGAMQPIPTLLETSAMNENEEAPDGAGDAPEAADDSATRSLPVLVEFELGRLELTLGELAGLQPGYVFPLPAFVEGANVTIRANGRAAGRGELVAVGDTLGVRLVSWS